VAASVIPSASTPVNPTVKRVLIDGGSRSERGDALILNGSFMQIDGGAAQLVTSAPEWTAGGVRSLFTFLRVRDETFGSLQSNDVVRMNHAQRAEVAVTMGCDSDVAAAGL